jgi:hypothetical protein
MKGEANKDTFENSLDFDMGKPPSSLCPISEGDDRHLYKFVNQTSLVLYCDECSSIWLEPDNLGYDGACGKDAVEKKFGSNIDNLFNEEGPNSARWAKKEKLGNRGLLQIVK